jgi:nitroimidazol reductase NimA-like FMN-containing flavoprotein (pyridoxamine 5'-phosphate oxidase superfamily)
MRRSDKEIKDRKVIDDVIGSALICRVAMCDGDTPYVVPLCFAYDGARLYLHSAPAGRKIDVLRRNPKVCFEMESSCELVHSEKACACTMRYRSVIGFGPARIVEDEAEKKRALELIVRRYVGPEPQVAVDPAKKTVVIVIDIQEVTGKQSGF